MLRITKYLKLILHFLERWLTELSVLLLRWNKFVVCIAPFTPQRVQKVMGD